MRSSVTFGKEPVSVGAQCSGRSPLFGTTYRSRKGVLLACARYQRYDLELHPVLIPLQRILRRRQGSHARIVDVRRFCFEDALALLCSPLAWLTVSNVWNMAAVERGRPYKHLSPAIAAERGHWHEPCSALPSLIV